MILVQLEQDNDPNPIFGIRIAKKEAEKSRGKFKLGAVILRKGKILSKGYNKIKTHPTFGSKVYKNLHAEGAALYNAYHRGLNVKGCTMVVYRKNFTTSKPCSDCLKLLKAAGIKTVYYTVTLN